VAKRTTKAAAAVDWKSPKLAGKSVHFAGRFEKWGDLTEELLTKWITLEGASNVDKLDATVDYLVLKEATGSSTHEKKAAQLNAKGAAITVIEASALRALLLPTGDEVLALLQEGPKGWKMLEGRLHCARLNDQLAIYQGCPYTIQGLKLTGMNIKDAPLWCVDLVESDLSKSKVSTEPHESYSIGNMIRSKLDGVVIHCTFPDLIECSCKGADLSQSWVGFLQDKSRCNSDFTNAKLVGFNFLKTDMTGSTLEKADLTKTRFERVNATGVNFKGACLKSIETEKSNFSNADFTRADLSDAELVEANLSGCNLTKAKLCGARLMNARLTGACVDGADFTGANLSGADLTGVDTSKAIGLVTSAKTVTIGPKLKELSDLCKKAADFETTMEVKAPSETLRLKVRARQNYGRASWSRDLWASTLSDWDQQTQSAADAFVAVVGMWPEAVPMPQTVTATGMKIGLNSRKLRQLAMEAWCETYGIPCPNQEQLDQLSKSAESDKDKVRAKLLADFDKPNGVKKWNGRSHLDLETVKSFPDANLSGKTLDGVDLHSLEFDRANFEKASLKGANLNYASFKDSNFKRAKLTGFVAHFTSFENSDFTGADLTDSELNLAHLQKASFSKAKLTRTSLERAHVQGADFSAASLVDCKWDGAEFDETTTFPKGFTIPDAMKWKGKDLDPRTAGIVAAASGPIDMGQFLTILEASIEKERLSKAKSMLKAERFRLFAECTTEHLVGVVKSQNDPDLVYSCRLSSAGDFACCTQNLNPCGGLRGSLCKHLLVLIIGMANAGDLDPTTVNLWIASARRRKPELNKDLMSETLIRYKGAEAGEIDWRPTETIPEDFFAL
jgi:uncharacterized protein YjbI with pentapeptide repeats